MSSHASYSNSNSSATDERGRPDVGSTRSETTGLTEREQMEVYVWIDSLRLRAKRKKHFARDFSDGVLAAEIVMNYFPRLVAMHNYPAKNNVAGKRANWETLNQKALQKLRCALSAREIEDVANCKQDSAEKALLKIKTAVEDVDGEFSGIAYALPTRTRYQTLQEQRNTTTTSTTSATRGREQQESNYADERGKRGAQVALSSSPSSSSYSRRFSEHNNCLNNNINKESLVGTSRNTNATTNFRSNKNSPRTKNEEYFDDEFDDDEEEEDYEEDENDDDDDEDNDVLYVENEQQQKQQPQRRVKRIVKEEKKTTHDQKEIKQQLAPSTHEEEKEEIIKERIDKEEKENVLKDALIRDCETLALKCTKYEQLLRVKDARIASLLAKIAAFAAADSERTLQH